MAWRWMAAGAVLALVLATVGTATTASADPWHQGGEIEVKEKTKEVGLWDPLLGMFVHNAATADVNGDGWLDLFVGGFYQQLPWDRFFRFGTGARRRSRPTGCCSAARTASPSTPPSPRCATATPVARRSPTSTTTATWTC